MKTYQWMKNCLWDTIENGWSHIEIIELNQNDHIMTQKHSCKGSADK